MQARRAGAVHALRRGREHYAVRMTNPSSTPDSRVGTGLRIGVLALQGDFREHAAALASGGAEPVVVRRPGELAGLDGLVIPGGESTAIDKLVPGVRSPRPAAPDHPRRTARLRLVRGHDPPRGPVADPATDLDGNPQQTFGGLDMMVRRNAFGRQRDSFETDLDFKGLDFAPPATVGLPSMRSSSADHGSNASAPASRCSPTWSRPRHPTPGPWPGSLELSQFVPESCSRPPSTRK